MTHLNETLGVAVIGAGRWARKAHLPAWRRDRRARVLRLVDTDEPVLAESGRLFEVEDLATDYREALDDPRIDVIDVVTSNRAHFEIAWAGLEAGKHVLCEKPVHHDFRQTQRAADLAKAKGLKTKLGFTFRYAPATLYAKDLIDQGFVGEPYVFNGYEQNSQWIDPSTPMRQVPQDGSGDEIAVSSIEGYGAPIIDIMHWWVGRPLEAVVGTMRNLVPVRMVRDTARMERLNIDDADMWICELSSGVLASIQSSYVTVGNYPGVEARLYGSEGAVIVRLVEERGVCQTLHTATRQEVEFTERSIPQRFFPEGGSSREPWDSLFYSNLVADFISEILSGSADNQGDFQQGALVQETINAFEASYRSRSWVDFPLRQRGGAGGTPLAGGM